MGCDLTSGRLIGCTDKMGGAKTLFLANFDQDKVYLFPQTAKEITDMPAINIFRYELEEGAGGLTQTITKSGNGSRSYDISGEITIPEITKEMEAEIDLITASKLWVWTLDKNGQVKMYGLESGIDAAGTIEEGAAKGDLSGYKLTFAGSERVSAPLMQAFTNFPFDNYTATPPTIAPAYPVV